MKAADIRVGDKIDGWTVTKYIDDHVRQRSGWQSMVLFTMEYSSWARNPARLYEDQYLPLPGDKRVTETRRIWYRADEDVEVER